MSKIKIAVLAALALACSSAGLYAFWNDGDRDEFLTLYGNIDIRQVNLAFRVDGRLEKMLAEEGDAVKAGQVLAALDAGYLEDAVAAAKAVRDAQAAQVAKLAKGSRPQEIEQAKAAVVQAESLAANARRNYERTAKLAKDSNASKQNRDNTQAAMQQADAALRSAREALALAEEGARSEDRNVAAAQLAGAEAGLSVAERKLADAQLASPSDGVITTRIHEPGAMLSAGSPVFTLSLVAPVYVRAYVSEPELARVRPGMRAHVLVDGLPGRVFPGQVGFISPVAEFTPKTVETTDLRASLVYRLRIIMDGEDPELRQGMPVTVRLLP